MDDRGAVSLGSLQSRRGYKHSSVGCYIPFSITDLGIPDTLIWDSQILLFDVIQYKSQEQTPMKVVCCRPVVLFRSKRGFATIRQQLGMLITVSGISKSIWDSQILSKYLGFPDTYLGLKKVCSNRSSVTGRLADFDAGNVNMILSL